MRLCSLKYFIPGRGKIIFKNWKWKAVHLSKVPLSFADLSPVIKNSTLVSLPCTL